MLHALQYIFYYLQANVHMCGYICVYIYIYKYMFCFDGVSQGDLVAMRFDLMTNIHNSL